jgi:hypothetical protein
MQPNAVTIPLTVDELKAMIREAVQEAMKTTATMVDMRNEDAEIGRAETIPGQADEEALAEPEVDDEHTGVLQSIEDSEVQW